MIWNYLALFVGGFACSLLLTPLVGIAANKWNVVDVPRGRHLHERVTPKLGGIAIFLSIMAVTLFTTHLTVTLWTMLGVGMVFMLIGVMDDTYDISPWTKLLGQLAGAIILTLGGIQADFVGNPFTTAIVGLGAWASVFTVLWVVGLVNAVNWSDGIDGLATGVCLISSIVLAILSYKTGHEEAVRLAVIFSGALAGFLIYNFHPAKIFLGDSGTMFIGYYLAVLGFLGGAKIATALLLLGIPILDGGFTVLYRWLHGQPAHLGDDNHLHFRLLKHGLGHIKIAFIFYLISAGLGITALFFSGRQKILLMAVLLVVYTAGWFGLLRISERKK